LTCEEDKFNFEDKCSERKKEIRKLPDSEDDRTPSGEIYEKLWERVIY
jgi:hypothetical protein